MLSLLNLLIASIALTYLSATDGCYTTMDLCFVVDASQSICAGDPNYTKGQVTCIYWKSMLTLMENIVKNLTIGPAATRVAVVIYATKGMRVFNLTRGVDQATVVNMIHSLNFTAGYSNISGALDVMMYLVFNQTYGDNPVARNVAVMYTGGNATDPSTVQAAVDRVHAAGVTTLTIGLSGDPYTAKQIASDPKQINEEYFLVDSFLNLNQIFDNLMYQLCTDTC